MFRKHFFVAHTLILGLVTSSHRQSDSDTGELINNYFFSSNHGDAATTVYEDASTY